MSLPRRGPKPYLLLAFLCLVALLPPTAFPQSATQGSLAGTVYDETNAVIPAASIALDNPATGFHLALTADTAGNYRAPQLEPGRYQVTISSDGFGQQAVLIDVRVGQVANFSPRLIARAAPQDVSVTASVDDIRASGPDFATVITSREIENLPVNERRWSDFALLTPAAVPDNANGDISFRGISGLMNNTTLDGADSSQDFHAQGAGNSRVEYGLSQASVREFQVNSSNYSAQYGRAAGSVINTVTKHGTNNFHGELFFFDRDNLWGALNGGSTVTTPTPDGTLTTSIVNPRDWRKQWGAAIGGPIIRDHAYFFYTYDQEQRNFPALSTVTNSPTFFFSQAGPADSSGNPVNTTCTAETTGDNAYTGSETNPLLYGTQGACFLQRADPQLYPTYAGASASYNNGLAYIYSLLGVSPRHNSQIINFPRIDLRINDRSFVTLEYNRMRYSAIGGTETQPYVNVGTSTLGDDYVKLDQFIARYNAFITSNLVNEFRAGYARDLEYQYARPPLPQQPLTALNGTASPGVSIDDQLQLGQSPSLNRNQYPDERRTQASDILTWILRNHSIHVGADFQHVEDSINAIYAEAGNYSYTNVQNFLIDNASQASPTAFRCGTIGAPQLCYSSYEQGFGLPGFTFSTNDYAAFAQDDWKVNSRLVLNAGIRYEYQALPKPIFPNPNLPATNFIPSDGNNFGPRAGFALDVFGTGRTVLRGGYGIYYGRIINSQIFNALGNTASTYAQQLFTLTSTAGAGVVPLYPATLIGPPLLPSIAGPTVSVFAHNFQNPEVQQADLELEQAIGWNTVVSATGLLSLGRHLPISIDENLAPPSSVVRYNFTGGGPLNGDVIAFPLYTGARPNPNFGPIDTYESRVNSTYAAFVLEARRGLTRSLFFRTNFTFSHATDDGQHSGSGPVANQVLDPYNFPAEYGTSDYDHRWRATASLVWTPHIEDASTWQNRLLNYWQFTGTGQFMDGAPYSALLIGTPPGVLNTAGTTLYPTSFGYLGAGGADFLAILGRNHYRQPGIQLVNLRITRQIPIAHNYVLELIGEAYNLLNHLNVSGVDSTVGVNNVAYQIGSGQAAGLPIIASYQPTFGQITGENSTPLYTQRLIQAGARLTF